MERKPNWMVSPAYGPELPFERIAINEGALCIECKIYGRRSALTKKNCPHFPGIPESQSPHGGGYEVVPEIWARRCSNERLVPGLA